ncbi:unknown similar to AMEV172 [Mythimna separata entomopoxvirus 'L']|uniref:Thioredoxin domain-containing protein n=1 Tax=Mythimna separata entomopoxvirus 'L' TaxID=1293572 RepID=A0A916P208_9POXV|nr:unknown similar to AMEV172 [Mythimna separata entomopoxvirus 'L']CCU56410.1 unknown similar to AMEV172 [Mythimna separata entomopoxvirus 'L']
MNKPVIICIYMKECKFCQSINDFLDYLSKTKKIVYIRVNINKIGNTMLEMFKYNDIQNINLKLPCLYLYDKKKLINLNNSEFLKYSVQYTNSLQNTIREKSFLDRIMLM